MADPLNHDDLTSLDTRREAYRLTSLISKVLEGNSSKTAVKIALVAALTIAVDADNEDFDDVTDQIRDAFDTDAVTVSEAEISDIDDQLYSL